MRATTKILLIFAYLTAFVGCKPRTESDVQTDGLEAEGASNTRGVGATFPLETRVVHHMRKNSIDTKKLLGKKQVMFSVDYFFPTNFPKFSDASVNENQITTLVTKELDSIATRFDYMIILGLFNRQDLKKENQARVDESAFAALKEIESKLNATALTKKKVVAINNALAAYARSHPKLTFIPANDFIDQVIDKRGYVRAGASWNIKPSHLFASDKIHATDHGQAVFFNYSLKKYLQKIPEFKNSQIPDMEIPWRYDDEWKKDVINTIAGSPDDFKNDLPNDYWGRVPDLQKFYTANAKLSNGAQTYAASVAGLQGIRDRIALLVYIGGATSEHYVSLATAADGKRILTLDLSKTIFFTNLDLVETAVGSGKFIGYGYDYWSSVEGSPVVNYKFTALQNKNDKAVLDIKWQMFPMLMDPADKTVKQKAELLRIPLKDQKWIKVLETNMKSIPVLEYNYQLRIVAE